MDDVSIDLSRLLSSNDVPRFQEAAFVQQEINRLSDQIRVLETRLREHKAIISPVRKLPPELLGCTFYLATAGEAGYMGWEEREDLMSIALVCKAWYNAVLHTPQLWGHLELDPDSQTVCMYATRWLGRANQGSRLVKISGFSCMCSVDYDPVSGFNQDDVDEDSPCYFQSESLTRLLTVGPILDTLHLELRSSMCFVRLMKSINTSKPDGTDASWDYIRSLFLEWDGDGPWIEAQNLSRVPSASSPRPLLPRPILLHIPPSALEHITSLTISSVWPGLYILDVLQHCKNLETLCVQYGGLHVEERWWEDASIPIVGGLVQSGVVLPRLQALELLELDFTSTGGYLPYLHVPSLTSLTTGFRRFWYQERVRNAPLQGVTNLLASLEEHTPNVKKNISVLKISREEEVEEVDTHALVDMLADLTSLSQLTLKYLTFDTQALKTLAPSPFLPCLRHVGIVDLQLQLAVPI